MAADSTPEEEVRRLERHYSVNPEGLVFARLADAYRRCGRRERALELLREGLERHPDYATGHLIEGRTLREEGRPEEAASSFRRVLELDAENLVALRSLAEMAAERGDHVEARRWADRLKRADPFATFRPTAAGEAADVPEPGAPEPAPPEGDRLPADGLPPSGDAASDDDPPGPDDGGRLPGEDGLASEIAAMADDQWWRSPAEEREADDDGEVATETMAHLYAQQGLYEEAAEVYRRLLDRRPEDGELRSRLEEMERRAGGEGPEETAGGGSATAPDGERAGSDDGRSPEPRAESDPPSREDGPTAREHFRDLLRGRARHGDGTFREKRSSGGPSDGETPRAVGGTTG